MASAWTWGFGLVALGIAAALADRKSAGAAGVPRANLGAGAPLQTRPIPAWDALSDAGKLAYLDVARQQLAYLSATFGDPSLNPGAVTVTLADVDNAASPLQQAIGAYAGSNPSAVGAYGYSITASPAANLVAALRAIDDDVRNVAPGGAAARAPDYLPPVAPTGSLAGARPNARRAPVTVVVPLPLRGRTGGGATRPSG